MANVVSQRKAYPPRGLLITIAILLVVAVVATPIYTSLIPPPPSRRDVSRPGSAVCAGSSRAGWCSIAHW